MPIVIKRRGRVVVLTLRFPPRVYEVVKSRGRDFGRLLAVWQDYLAPRSLRKAPKTLRILEVGVRYEFGHLFDPPRKETHAELAQVFKVKKTTIQSWLRRYREITADRAIR